MAGTIEAYLLALTSTMGQGIMATPVSTSMAGTSVSNGTTETLDSSLGTYQFNAVAGRRYGVVLNGMLGGATAVNVYAAVRIRNSGSSSAPTNTSTLVAASSWICVVSGGPGQTSLPVAGSFIAGANGVNTIGMFSVVLAGTGTFTPVSTRELYVVDLGVF